MQCQSVFTHITDEYLAVERLRSELRQEHLSYIICYYTEEYDSIRETEDGGIELFTQISVGEELTLMKGSREHLIARAAKVVNAAFNQKLEESRKIGVINIFCAGPMLHLMQDMNSVCEQINQELEHLPFICPFTFGEQGRFIGGENGHGNLMISSAIFHKPYER